MTEQKKARPALSAAGTLPTQLTGNANLPQVGFLPCDICMYTLKWICFLSYFNAPIRPYELYTYKRWKCNKDVKWGSLFIFNFEGNLTSNSGCQFSCCWDIHYLTCNRYKISIKPAFFIRVFYVDEYSWKFHAQNNASNSVDTSSVSKKRYAFVSHKLHFKRVV